MLQKRRQANIRAQYRDHAPLGVAHRYTDGKAVLIRGH